MKYEKPTAEVVEFEGMSFMASSGISCFAVHGGSMTDAEVASSGLSQCGQVSWNGTYSNENPAWPLINCSAVTFGNGTYKNDQVYTIPCKTYHS